MPQVDLGTPFGDRPVVAIDVKQGMRALLIHLIEEHGYQRIALIRGLESHTYGYHAFIDTLQEKGLRLDERLISPALGWNKGMEAMSVLLDERGLQPGRDLQAVVAVSDLLAIGAIRLMAERGIQVPTDVAVAGFNDISLNLQFALIRYNMSSYQEELFVHKYSKIYMRVFITGATGFAGSHLVNNLVKAGHEIFCLVHKSTSHQLLLQQDVITLIPGDLLNQTTLMAAIAQAKPDVVYHLAGQAYPMQSWLQPSLTLAVNSVGTANLLQAVVAYGCPRVIVVTSAEIYGKVEPEDLPITEQTLPKPSHPYGISKWAASMLVSQFWERYQLPVVEARPFNHIGPHQALGFVMSDFASQLVKIRAEQRPSRMLVGNLETMRDFTDVRDVVWAYELLAEKGQPGETYLICSGQPVKIETILRKMIEIAGVEVKVEYDPEQMRPSDTPCLYGSFGKLATQTGWHPRYSLEQSLRDILEDWDQRI